MEAMSSQNKAPLPAPVPKVVSGGVMNGKATSLPKPAYPAAAMAVRASGSVNVQILINETGRVISANAVSGHPLLRAAATQAASAATFAPPMHSSPFQVSGVIIYNFVLPALGASTTTPSSDGPGVVTPSAEQLRELRRKRTMHTWLYALVERLEKKTSPTPNESQFVREGKASVEITFSGAVSATLLDQLKAIGFEVGTSQGASTTGTIPIEKLRELAEIGDVKYVMPRIL